MGYLKVLRLWWGSRELKSEGGGGVVVGGEFFLASEDKGADVSGVEAGDDGFGAVVVLGGEDVCCLE